MRKAWRGLVVIALLLTFGCGTCQVASCNLGTQPGAVVIDQSISSETTDAWTAIIIIAILGLILVLCVALGAGGSSLKY